MANATDPRAKALEDARTEGKRVRVLIGDRKMKWPGVVVKQDDGTYAVQANWGRSLSVPLDDNLKELEVADERGRFHAIAS